jgi:3-hydroxybutyryl-CoA dehydrogenase
MSALGWHFQTVPDIPGMIAPRIIAMIINEAYYGLGDGISSKEAIDIAMKLGTNYPMGPFEWCEKLGIDKVYRLLEKLQTIDKRYALAPSMKTEMNQKNTGL